MEQPQLKWTSKDALVQPGRVGNSKLEMGKLLKIFICCSPVQGTAGRLRVAPFPMHQHLGVCLVVGLVLKLILFFFYSPVSFDLIDALPVSC